MADASGSQQPMQRPSTHALAWVTGITSFLLLVLAIGDLVIPLWRTRTHLEEYLTDGSEASASKFVTRIGGPEAAVRHILLYRRMPRWLAPHRDNLDVISLLGHCGKAGVPALLDIVCTGRNDLARLTALKTLANRSPIDGSCAGVLAEATKASTEAMRFYAVVALSELPKEIAGSTAPILREALWAPPEDRTLEENVVLIGGFLWDVAPEVFVQELQSPDPAKRCVMLRALPGIERRDQHEGLLPRTVGDMSLNDRDPVVRETARDALERIKAAQEKKQQIKANPERQRMETPVRIHVPPAPPPPPRGQR